MTQEKMGMGESISHRAEIDRLVLDGYMETGFMAFIKLALFSLLSNRSIDVCHVWREASQKDALSGYRHIDMELRRVKRAIIDPDCIGYAETLSRHFSDLTVLPDAWLYDGNNIVAIEVCNTSECHEDKLMRYAQLDDYLYEAYENDIRIQLFEKHLNYGGKVTEHNLNIMFEFVESPEGMTKIWSNEGSSNLVSAYYNALHEARKGVAMDDAG